MPAGTAHAPGRLPGDLILFLARLPERKVERILFLLFDRDAGARFEVVDVLLGKLAVLGELAGAVIDITVHLVRVTLVDQILDELDDVRDRLGDFRMHGRRCDVERLRVLVVLLDIFLADFRRGHAFLSRLVDDLVVHVGEVLDEVDLLAAVLEVLAHRVEDDERARVADVEIVIDRRAADVHVDDTFLLRDEFFFSSCQCVIDLHILLLLVSAENRCPCPVRTVFLFIHAAVQNAHALTSYYI